MILVSDWNLLSKVLKTKSSFLLSLGRLCQTVTIQQVTSKLVLVLKIKLKVENINKMNCKI